MMKKKIFILGHWMRIDGVATSLLGLLKELDYSKVDVDLMLMSAEGELLEELPRQVNLLNTHPSVVNYWSDKPTDGKRSLLAVLLKKGALLIAGVWYRIFRRMKIDPYGMHLIKGLLFNMYLPKRIVDKEYDLALFFSCEPFLVGRVGACKSAVWVHTDWGSFNPITFLVNISFGRADYIVNVSSAAKKSFDRYLNDRNKGKSIVIENIISPRWVMDKSLHGYVVESTALKILSVGRVTPHKNYFRALEAAKILAERGVDFVWYIVGGGESFDALEAAAKLSGLSDRFKLLGPQQNPYPYYKWCDIVVCTSDFEGKSVSVREAQMFAKPVVVTKFPTAASQVEDGIDGILVERTPQAVADGVALLMHDSVLRKRLSANCKSRDYANLGEIDKILSLMK